MTNNRISVHLMIGATISISVIMNIRFMFFNVFDPFALDFKVFWRAAREPLFSLYRSHDSPFINPPTALVFFKPLTFFEFKAGYILWTVASLALFAFAASKATNLRVACISLFSGAAGRCFALGQSTLMLGAAIIYAFTLPQFVSGLVLGLVASIKPQLLFFAPLTFLVRREWRALLGMALSTLISAAAATAFFGISLWVDWIAAMPAFYETLHREHVIEHVVSPAGAAEAFGLNPVPVLILSILLGAVAIMTLARKLEGVFLAALVVGASIFASPYALTHDTIVLVPACVLCILRRANFKALPAIAVYCGVAFVWAAPLLAILVALRSRRLNYSANVPNSTQSFNP